MASIANDPGGRKRICFVSHDGRHRAVSLGKASVKQAETVRTRVEHLLNAQAGLAVDPETARWVASVSDKLAARLAKQGLIAPRIPAAPVEPEPVLTLGAHLDQFMVRATAAKERTQANYEKGKRSLLAFFGPDRPLDSITVGDGKDFDKWLRTPAARLMRYAGVKTKTGLAENTARRRVGLAQQFFNDAVDRGLIARNPFNGLSSNVTGNKEREYFITRDQASKVLAACGENLEWRLLFALSRFGGLRCPSEHLALTWADVDWERGRLFVRSPKTAHHAGRESRLVPIFPELRPHLEAAYDAAAEGTVHVITRYRDSGANLRTQFQRIVKAAGLVPWPKLFQNLRATRETELLKSFPAHVVASWIGHSVKVQNEHYAQVTDEDFERASKSCVPICVQSSVDDARQRVPTSATNEHDAWETADTMHHASQALPTPAKGMSGIGLEPTTSTMSTWRSNQLS